MEIGEVIASEFPRGFGLDLGCGDGKLTKIILKNVGEREMVGVDIDPHETSLAQQLGIYKRVHTSPANQIPEKTETFDFVFSNSVLEHIDNIEQVLGETSRLLKPGGLFLFTVPGDEFHRCLRGPILPFAPRQNYLDSLDARTAHRRYWSLEDWGHHLRVYNLKIEKVAKYFNQQEVRRWETLSRFTSGILYPLFGKKKHPIEIQRALGMRRAHAKTPKFLARWLRRLFLLRLDTHHAADHLNGCLMLRARKS